MRHRFPPFRTGGANFGAVPEPDPSISTIAVDRQSMTWIPAEDFAKSLILS
jgi:hypothetical protein